MTKLIVTLCNFVNTPNKVAPVTQAKMLHDHNGGTYSPDVHFIERAVIPVHIVLQALFSPVESF
jgi:hypothetical protein